MNEVKNKKLNRIKQRNWRIDLLRIIAMMYVVVLHFLKYGGVLQELEQVDRAYLIFWGIEGVAYKAVCIFVLISGYYFIESYFKPSRFIRFYIQVAFYSIALYAVSIVIGKANLGGISILKAITPITSGIWWYVTEYMLLLLCFPIINMIIHSVSKEKLKCIISVLIFIYSIWQTICFWNYGVFDNGYGIEWFIVLYFIAAYIRLYGISIKKSVLISTLFICDFLMIVSRICGYMIAQRFAAYNFFEELWYTYTSPLVLISAVSIFLLFEKSKRCVPPPFQNAFQHYLKSLLECTYYQSIHC